MRFSTGKSGFLTVPVGCLLTAAIALACFANTSTANDGLTSNAIIHRAGLTVEWFAHSGTGVAGGLADWHINVNENKPTTFFTIKAGKYHEQFSQNTLSAFGKPFGIEGARDYANVRSDVLKAEFANDGITDIEVQLSEYTLPETTIYTLTSDGVVKAIDGDTGATKWSSPVGKSQLPSIGVGSSNEFVAVVNGSTLYCLDANNGKIKWSAKCRYAASAPPTVSEEKIYVPLLNGRLETFDLAKKGLDSYAFVAKGRGTARPVLTEKTVAWPTSEGDLNVAAKYGTKSGVAYQLRSDAAIVSPPAYKEGMFFVTSLDGFLYAVDEIKGVVVWQVSTGSSVSQSPIAMGNYIYVINGLNQLYKIDARTGFEATGWELPRTNIARFVGAGKENMYVIDVFGNLLVMSQNAGAIVSTVKIGGVKNILPNAESDRLYMVSDQGTIQCIREIASPIPHFHSNEFVAVDVEPGRRGQKADDSDQSQPGAADLDDPFGGGTKTPAPDADNPFGGTTPAPAGDADNPFGGGADKSDAGASPAPDDDDPFK